MLIGGNAYISRVFLLLGFDYVVAGGQEGELRDDRLEISTTRNEAATLRWCSKEKIREKIVINILITQFHLQVCIHVHILSFAAHPIPITATRSPSSRLSPWFLNELNLTALQSVNRHNVWSIEAIMTLMSLTALLLCKRSNPCKVWRACVKSSDCFVSTQTSSILVRICMWKTRSVGKSLVASSTPWDQSAARGQAEGAPESTAATSEIREAAAEGGRRTVTRQINYSCHGSSVISS